MFDCKKLNSSFPGLSRGLRFLFDRNSSHLAVSQNEDHYGSRSTKLTHLVRRRISFQQGIPRQYQLRS